MPNTVENIQDARELVGQLILKTLERKLQWSTGTLLTDGYQPNQFRVSLGNELTIRISATDEDSDRRVYGIQMKDGADNELLKVGLETNPRYGYSLPGESELSAELVRLHELARRTAFGVDSKVSRAKTLLHAL